MYHDFFYNFHVSCSLFFFCHNPPLYMKRESINQIDSPLNPDKARFFRLRYLGPVRQSGLNTPTLLKIFSDQEPSSNPLLELSWRHGYLPLQMKSINQKTRLKRTSLFFAYIICNLFKLTMNEL